jgi:hypothetical protein
VVGLKRRKRVMMEMKMCGFDDAIGDCGRGKDDDDDVKMVFEALFCFFLSVLLINGWVLLP